MTKKVQHATNCFLVRGDKVLLGMKKRGLGVGWWNGFGGKTDNGESVELAAVRETKEEIGVEILKFGKAAEFRCSLRQQGGVDLPLFENSPAFILERT